MRKKLLIVNGLAAAAVAVALVVTAPGAEAAVIPIGSVAVPFTVTAPVTTYSVTASSGRWSVVGSWNVARMTLRRPFILTGGTLRTVGTEADPDSSWIAMDNRPGRRPTGLYHVSVTSAVNTWTQLQFLDGGPELVNGQTFATELPAGHWVVDLREVRLTKGDVLTLKTSGASLRAISVLHSVPFTTGNHTFSRLNADAVHRIGKPATVDEVDTFSFTAPQTGDYAVIFENGWYGETATGTPAISRGAIP